MPGLVAGMSHHSRVADVRVAYVTYASRGQEQRGQPLRILVEAGARDQLADRPQVPGGMISGLGELELVSMCPRR